MRIQLFKKIRQKTHRSLLRYLFILVLIINTSAINAFGEDMREMSFQARQSREALLQKARAEEKDARKASDISLEAIAKDRRSLEQALEAIEKRVQSFEKEVKQLSEEADQLAIDERALSEKLALTDSVAKELVGVIRINAKDMDAMIDRCLQTALLDERPDFLEAIAGQAKFPGMEDVEHMVETMWEQVRQAGDVRLTRGAIIDRFGNTIEADILLLGNFTAAYRTGEEVGFLTYSPAGQKLFALSRLPSHRFQKQLKRYMAGEDDAVPMDVSRGAALSQLTHELNLWQQIPKGGPIVWPILAILGLGVLIILERLYFLFRRKFNADHLTRRIAMMAEAQDWKGCQAACKHYAEKPAARVLTAGLSCCQMGRETMENALQEAILREVPPMERFLSTLGILAAIAPLLGLLGTVTGMIDTFHVITRHGTGDPRMMSGGISEALVTTMLGLSVAIPIMLAHTLLSRAVDKHIGQMEEKAVALVNIVEKNRNLKDGISA